MIDERKVGQCALDDGPDAAAFDAFAELVTRGSHRVGLRCATWENASGSRHVGVDQIATGPNVRLRMSAGMWLGKGTLGVSVGMHAAEREQWWANEHKWTGKGEPTVDGVFSAFRHALSMLAQDALLCSVHSSERRRVAVTVWRSMLSHMNVGAWLAIQSETEARLRRPKSRETIATVRADIAAAREAIRILLGEAGLDGLGDLTTADGRSVIDVVRRGLGATS